MKKLLTKYSAAAAASVMASALLATSAYAGGLAVREQSAQFQGSSFAGAAAGGGLSSGFWNSAAFGEAGYGLSTESNYSIIMPNQDFTSITGTSALIGGAGNSANNDRVAIVPASYGAYRLNDKLVLGVAINSPFGISTELDNQAAGGSFFLHHRSAAILTINVNPVASYEVAPGLFIGLGAQAQYFDAKFKVASGIGGGPSAGLNGDDIGFGYTAGVLWKPSEQTSIGIGFRSSISHKIEGDQYVVGVPALNNSFSIDLETPEMVTLSLRQQVSPRSRLMATVEWTNWDRLGVLPINGPAAGPLTGSNLDFQWDDGWYFALGGEYDYTDKLTLRGGISYEISPVQNPTQRLVQSPDADRIWLSAGATYNLSSKTAINLGYSHVFVEDSTLNRLPANGAAVPLVADVEQYANIFTLGFKTKLGGN